jgi:transcription-repair coupling factor (superfamily II helicase)
MSLIGLRDISVIETAPLGRKAVKTYVGEYDEIMVREAILRELARGGQIYYLHNRVADIEKTREKVERLIPAEFSPTPEAQQSQRVLIAHGQMRDERLEEIMHAFELGAYRVLLATTIIENGLDIPAVNTIIIDHAESLGLSQMHQLRGRVGRSSQQAYAYFFHEPQRVLTEEAQNRLHAIYNYAYLGAGYEIAQNDLRIRGAGNLLGEDQSGLAKQVGFEYYCELLARSIRDVKELSDLDLDSFAGLPTLDERPGVQLDIPLPAHIPDDYIEDPVLRLELLRRISQLEATEAIDEFALEVEDRFGPPPAELSNLLLIMRVRNAANALGLERLTYNRTKGSFSLHFYSSEKDWYKRAGLRDGRFSQEALGGLTLALPFSGAQSGQDLLETLEGLSPLREVPVR